jgi:hypothetical protein
MIDHDYGPLRTYEITWQTGHVERIQGHQLILPPPEGIGLFSPVINRVGHIRRITIHGEFDGRWLLMLAAAEEDIRTIRDVTAGEWIDQQAGGESS